jgi:hypothetical protein
MIKAILPLLIVLLLMGCSVNQTVNGSGRNCCVNCSLGQQLGIYRVQYQQALQNLNDKLPDYREHIFKNINDAEARSLVLREYLYTPSLSNPDLKALRTAVSDDLFGCTAVQPGPDYQHQADAVQHYVSDSALKPGGACDKTGDCATGCK